jgi:hypothetical protein
VQTRLQIDERSGAALGHIFGTKHGDSGIPPTTNVLEARLLGTSHWRHTFCLNDHRVKTHDCGSLTTTNDTKRKTMCFLITTDGPGLDSSER